MRKQRKGLRFMSGAWMEALGHFDGNALAGDQHRPEAEFSADSQVNNNYLFPKALCSHRASDLAISRYPVRSPLR
jgi:hypothetical protein